jgi:general secretion pathway protein K
METHHNKRRRGFALIGVLWLVTLLSAVALALMSLSKTDAEVARLWSDAAKAEALADAGLYLTIRELCDPAQAQLITVDGGQRTVLFDAKAIEVSVQAEAGRVDLNFAPKELLSSLFETTGMTRSQALQLSELVEKKRHAHAGPHFFYRLEELKKLEGMTAEAFMAVRPALTVYSQSPLVDASVAPKQVLMALPGMNKAKADAVLASRRLWGEAHDLRDASGLEGSAYSISAKARVGGSVSKRQAVIRVTGDPTRPYHVLDYKSIIESDENR